MNIPMVENRSLAKSLYAEERLRHGLGLDRPLQTQLEIDRMWDECPSQQEWLYRATTIRRIFRIASITK